jgi:purine-binding chemotaxis protein CheW
VSVVAQRATLVPDPDSETGIVPVLAVAAGDEIYGFPLSCVREALVPPPLTEVPRAPAHVLGVISVRGQIITLFDLPRMLNLDVAHTQPYGRVMLVDNGQELIGVAVDRIVQVYRFEQGQIEFASTMGAKLSEYVVGIGRVPSQSPGKAEEMLILIDPVSLFGG